MDDITLRQMQSVTPVKAPAGRQKEQGIRPDGAPSFDDVLQERIASDRVSVTSSPIKFSAHAQTRLQSRSIPFGPEEVARLEDAVNRAQAKGARESLVLMDQVALVVSVRNRTVITAVDADSLKNNVFTNIDSAVIC